MIWSGLLIYWANDAYSIKLFGHEYFHFFPTLSSKLPDGTPETWYTKLGWDARLAEGMGWHFTFMWLFAINGLLYATYLVLSGEWRFLVPRRDTLKQAIHVVLHDLRLSKKPLPKQKFNGAQKIAYTSIILMGLGSVVTGIAIFRPLQVPWLTALLGGYDLARVWHFALMIGFLLFFVIHVLQVAKAGWNNFRAMVTGYELETAEEGTHE
jgi:thiosulfate reductase cytochrome b subunit